MAIDLTVHLENRPGALAEVGEALGSAGVNVGGVAAMASGGDSLAHLLVEDSESAQAALSSAGIDVASLQEVVVVAVEDEPGVLGKVCRQAAEAGINLTLTYLATDTRLVLAADDLAGLRSAVGG
jgi:hypothetical protein